MKHLIIRFIATTLTIVSLVRFFQWYIKKSRAGYEREIHDAARDGNLKRVKELLREDPDLASRRDEYGWTALHYAALHSHEKIVKRLLAAGCDVNAKDDTGQTPLHWVVDRYDMVVALVENKADVNAKDNHGSTPLHGAAMSNSTEICEFLLAHGADAAAKNHLGKTPSEMKTIMTSQRT